MISSRIFELISYVQYWGKLILLSFLLTGSHVDPPVHCVFRELQCMVIYSSSQFYFEVFEVELKSGYEGCSSSIDNKLYESL